VRLRGLQDQKDSAHIQDSLILILMPLYGGLE
jgi:hypothetical protein